MIDSVLAQQFATDGVVFVPKALSHNWIGLVEEGIERNLRNPGPHALKHFEGLPWEYYDDYCNFDATPEYQRLVKFSPLAPLVRSVLGSKELWLLFDQIFVKDGGEGKSTPWHQDSPYFLAEGRQQVSAWITLDALPKSEALEFVAGSHLGPEFRPDDPVVPGKPFYENSRSPELPDVNAMRDQLKPVSWAVEPGDLLIFHPRILHGGGAPIAGRHRRALSLRFFGEEVRFEKRIGAPSPPFYGLEEILRSGDSLCHPYFPQIL